ncbi:MAG: hypothetical protein ABR888_07470 [Thermoplasmata archaeon]|jgi:hypothetical protein
MRVGQQAVFPERGKLGSSDRLPLRLAGHPLPLLAYPAETITNRNFQRFDLGWLDRYFLPPTLTPLADGPEVEVLDAIEDDNRSAILPEPVATLDGLPFYLSVKGVGSTVDPFSLRRLDSAYATELTDDPEVRERLRSASGDRPGGVITGELWLRGSPYGGQGLPHAMTALRVSERADLTSIEGFRIAPVVKVALLPKAVEARLRSIHWYRKYGDRLVQELRLVPSNVRVYFHSRSTVGNDPGRVFDLYSIDSAAKAHQFETNFVRSGMALLTLFARTLTWDPARGRYSGLDFQDVWLDKDAILAPDGTVFFVDLEGIDLVSVEREGVREKMEDQIFRSLYEFMFAYEQIEGERERRFGSVGSRKRRFEAIVVESLQEDPFVRTHAEARGLALQVRNRAGEESLWFDFLLVDT